MFISGCLRACSVSLRRVVDGCGASGRMWSENRREAAITTWPSARRRLCCTWSARWLLWTSSGKLILRCDVLCIRWSRAGCCAQRVGEPQSFGVHVSGYFTVCLSVTNRRPPRACSTYGCDARLVHKSTSTHTLQHHTGLFLFAKRRI